MLLIYTHTYIFIYTHKIPLKNDLGRPWGVTIIYMQTCPASAASETSKTSSPLGLDPTPTAADPKIPKAVIFQNKKVGVGKKTPNIKEGPFCYIDTSIFIKK